MSIIGTQKPLSTSVNFVDKIEKLEKDLSTGKMWMNEACETQNKNSRFVRWIKCILSVILPVDLFVSIKADQVASNYIKFVERHKEYLNDKGALEKSKKVLLQLNEQTKEKYDQWIRICMFALDGLVPKKDLEPMGNDQKVEVKSEEKLDEDLISKEQNAETQIPELKESIETVNPLPLNQAEKDSDQIEPKDSEQKENTDLLTHTSLDSIPDGTDISVQNEESSEPLVAQSICLRLNESIIEGEFLNGDGKGTQKFDTGRKYEGEFRSFKFHGQGKESFGLEKSPFIILEGRFEDGKFKEGKMITDNCVEEGEFDGEHVPYLHGKGKRTFGEGRILEGIFEYGKLIYQKVPAGCDAFT